MTRTFIAESDFKRFETREQVEVWMERFLKLKALGFGDYEVEFTHCIMQDDKGQFYFDLNLWLNVIVGPKNEPVSNRIDKLKPLAQNLFYSMFVKNEERQSH